MTAEKSTLILPVENMDSEHCALIVDKALGTVPSVGAHHAHVLALADQDAVVCACLIWALQLLKNSVDGSAMTDSKLLIVGGVEVCCSSSLIELRPLQAQAVAHHVPTAQGHGLWTFT
jgi:hypothetical protein